MSKFLGRSVKSWQKGLTPKQIQALRAKPKYGGRYHLGCRYFVSKKT